LIALAARSDRDKIKSRKILVLSNGDVSWRPKPSHNPRLDDLFATDDDAE